VKTIYAESRKKLVSHMKPLRYSTTNSKVATVSSKGTIKAKTKGRCYIYVTAGSGAYTKILVKVK
ncbi:MAG: Ig-like domain-containing protein, partial [Eubacterium sp.]|nr:Ig-like domain-containing protein [Eubacterium sp.]